MSGFSLGSETVAEALVRVCAENPDGRALVWLTSEGVASLTWHELAGRAESAATLICQLVSGRPGRVVLVGVNSVDWVIAAYGCALAGVSVLPVSPFATLPELVEALQKPAVELVLTVETVAEHRVGDVVREAALLASNRPAVRGMAAWPAAVSAPSVRGPQDPAGEFLVQLTSGTTGRPKAASLSHQAVLNCARLFAEGAGGRPGDTWLNPLPLHHVGGFVSGMLACLASDSTYVVLDRFTPGPVLQALRKAKPTHIGMVPTMLFDLLAEPGVSDADFRSVRTVLGGATAVDPELIEQVERRLGIRFLIGYGQSESPCLAMTFPDDPKDVRTRSIGHPLPGREYCIRDRSGSVVSAGVDGELWVRGPLNMTGYLRDDGSLDAATDREGWLATGDVCALDERGVLWFRGRLREVIIRGGANVYPAEVEHALSGHPDVSELAVFGVPDVRLGERVVAAVVPVAGTDVDPEELTRFAATRIGVQKRPVEWIPVPAFPRTAAGKVRKQELRQWYRDGTIGFHCGSID